jgi:type IV pilus assembly protein PilN
MIKINLAPKPARKGFALSLPPLPRLGTAFGVALVLMVLGIGGYWYRLDSEAGRLQSEIARAQREMDGLKAAIAEGNRFKKEKEELELRVGAIDLIARNQSRPVHVLDAVADTVPQDLWLTALEEKEGRLRLGGVAFSSSAVADFMANLKRSGTFKEVDLVVSRQDLTKSPRLVTFEIACDVGI